MLFGLSVQTCNSKTIAPIDLIFYTRSIISMFMLFLPLTLVSFDVVSHYVTQNIYPITFYSLLHVKPAQFKHFALKFTLIDDFRRACAVKGNVPVAGHVKRVDRGDIFARFCFVRKR